MDNTGTDPRSRTRTNLSGWKHRKHLHTVPCSSHQRLYTHSVGAKKRLRLHIARLQEFGLEFGLAAPTEIAHKDSVHYPANGEFIFGRSYGEISSLA